MALLWFMTTKTRFSQGQSFETFTEPRIPPQAVPLWRDCEINERRIAQRKRLIEAADIQDEFGEMKNFAAAHRFRRI
jgi:hypothetical protein